VTTESKTKPDFRIPTATKWCAPRAVADIGGGTIIATSQKARSAMGLRRRGTEIGDPPPRTHQSPWFFVANLAEHLEHGLLGRIGCRKPGVGHRQVKDFLKLLDRQTIRKGDADVIFDLLGLP
jgi:hypothetical protein